MSQRKNYFISKGMQGKFAGTILLLAFLVAIITACNIYVLGSFFFSTRTTMTESASVTALMGNFFQDFWPRLLLLVFVNVIIIFIVSIMYSHQTAGPAYKLEKSIQRISEGDLTFQVSLRKNDNLKELAEALNELMEKFRVTLAKARSLSDDVSDKLGSLEDENMIALTKSAKELSGLIGQFKVADEDAEKNLKDSEDEKTEEDKS